MALIIERSRSFGGGFRRSDPESFLPLGDPAYFVLLALGGPPRPAYGLMQALEDANGLLPGTLHSTLVRLFDQGLLEEMDEPEEVAASPRQRYRVTSLGEAVLLAESGRRRRRSNGSHDMELKDLIARGKSA